MTSKQLGKSRLFVMALFVLILSSIGITLAIAAHDGAKPTKTTFSSMVSIYGMKHYS